MSTVVQSCRSKKPTIAKSRLDLLVNEYIERYGNSYDLEDRWWGDRTLTWENARSRAWESRLENGKMHRHQCRVAHKLSEGLEVALADKMQPEDFQNFQELHNWVQFVTTRVKGLGATTAYDVARRLGAWLNLKPVVIYLHAGTATGARKLGIEGEVALLDAFPKELQVLGATHLENFLCIYKNQL